MLWETISGVLWTIAIQRCLQRQSGSGFSFDQLLLIISFWVRGIWGGNEAMNDERDTIKHSNGVWGCIPSITSLFPLCPLFKV